MSASNLQMPRGSASYHLHQQSNAQVPAAQNERVAGSTARSSKKVRQITAPTQEAIEQHPSEIIAHIFSYLPPHELGKVAQVCRQWEDVSADEVIWKEICKQRGYGEKTENQTWKELAHQNVNSFERGKLYDEFAKSQLGKPTARLSQIEDICEIQRIKSQLKREPISIDLAEESSLRGYTFGKEIQVDVTSNNHAKALNLNVFGYSIAAADFHSRNSTIEISSADSKNTQLFLPLDGILIGENLRGNILAVVSLKDCSNGTQVYKLQLFDIRATLFKHCQDNKMWSTLIDNLASVEDRAFHEKTDNIFSNGTLINISLEWIGHTLYHVIENEKGDVMMNAFEFDVPSTEPRGRLGQIWDSFIFLGIK